ncbi:MAG: TetR/AcrR family transcriptional regulator [Mycobacterium sp.]|uniref:TetR/AcrR family transcriptional regulator n=3 Tax=Mycobacterium sp. TaxID=1785 RepID=UPI003F9440B8
MPTTPRETIRAVSPSLLSATASTLRRLGPRQFNLTAVAEVAGVSRGTVHNAFGNRETALKTALDELATGFIATLAAEIGEQLTLAGQVAAAANVICEHRRTSDPLGPRGFNESLVVLLLENFGKELIQRSVSLWAPLIRAAQGSGEVDTAVDPRHGAEWIVRVLFSFELLPPIVVNLDSPRAVRNFVCDHIVAGLTGDGRRDG